MIDYNHVGVDISESHISCSNATVNWGNKLSFQIYIIYCRVFYDFTFLLPVIGHGIARSLVCVMTYILIHITEDFYAYVY